MNTTQTLALHYVSKSNHLGVFYSSFKLAVPIQLQQFRGVLFLQSGAVGFLMVASVSSLLKGIKAYRRRKNIFIVSLFSISSAFNVVLMFLFIYKSMRRQLVGIPVLVLFSINFGLSTVSEQINNFLTEELNEKSNLNEIKLDK